MKIGFLVFIHWFVFQEYENQRSRNCLDRGTNNRPDRDQNLDPHHEHDHDFDHDCGLELIF